MKKFSKILLGLGLILSMKAEASVFQVDTGHIVSMAQTIMSSNVNFRVGDSLNFKLSSSPLPLVGGTMSMAVSSEEAAGYWITQNVDMGQMGKQVIETLIDRNTGKVLKMKVNGQDQAPPDSTIKVIETKEDTVTVPAGTYQAVYVKTEDEKGNQSEMWMNPLEIPVSGMLKMVTKQMQFLSVIVELVSFNRAP